jgi:peroxisomal 2,4-dienoyl-CoA reductase
MAAYDQLEYETTKIDSPFRPDLMSGKVVFITGGGSGIGFGMATAFGLHGAKIAIMGRREHVLQEAVGKLTAKGIDAMFCKGDVRKVEDLQACVDQILGRFKRLDVLVNNAAGNFATELESLTMNGFKTVLDIDLIGTFNASKACLPAFKQVGGGVVINITASLQWHATPFQGHAAAAKAGIDVMTNTMAIEWAEFGVRAIGIAPGAIAGTVGGPTGRVFGAMGLRAEDHVPVMRWGELGDVAYLALFLVSPAGSWITGEVINVDGGSRHRTDSNTKIRASKEMFKKYRAKDNEMRGKPKSKL